MLHIAQEPPGELDTDDYPPKAKALFEETLDLILAHWGAITEVMGGLELFSGDRLEIEPEFRSVPLRTAADFRAWVERQEGISLANVESE